MTLAGRPGTRALLLVDDESLILAAALCRTLRASDLELVTASPAEEALSILGTRSIDAILCDHRMPGTSGLDLLGQVASDRPHVRRALLTGLPETVDREQCRALGLSALIPKPWEREDLLRRVEALLPPRDGP